GAGRDGTRAERPVYDTTAGATGAASSTDQSSRRLGHRSKGFGNRTGLGNHTTGHAVADLASIVLSPAECSATPCNGAGMKSARRYAFEKLSARNQDGYRGTGVGRRCLGAGLAGCRAELIGAV